MTAFSLFDHFQSSRSACESDAHSRLMTVATRMVGATIRQFEEITGLDEGLASPEEKENVSFDMDTALALRLMYEECAKDAERVLARVDRFERDNGCVVAGSDVLRLWHTKTMAMLSVSAQDIAKGLADAQQGKLISVTAIRNELRPRLHT